MAKRKKIVAAGQWVRAVAYTVPNSTGDETARRARLRISSAARQKMNLKTSAQKLQVVLNANFGPRDLHVTLNYDDRHRPETKAAANRKLQRFFAKLRARRKVDGQELRYVYVTEQATAESRHVHHHIILNATGHDLQLIKELWGYGTDVEIQYLRDWGLGLEALAQYLTKEPRICGQPHVGERTWTPSLGLYKPKPETGYLGDGETLQEPFGAIVIKREEKKGEYGGYLYLEYWLPDGGDAENWSPPKTV